MKWKQRGKAYIAAAWVDGQPFVFVQTLHQGMVMGEVFPVPERGPVVGVHFAADFEAVCTIHGRYPASVRTQLELWAVNQRGPHRDELDEVNPRG